MQLGSWLIRSVLPFFATSALAAVDANSCTTQSSRMKSYERNAYIISCLAQLNTAASIKQREQQNLKALCEQNARNLNLRGSGQSRYLATCINSNEAEAVASKSWGKTAANTGQLREKKKKGVGHTSDQVLAKTKANSRNIHNRKRKADEHRIELAM